ncbi:MAG: hypothetical protein GY832_01200 [Chloroflexi bacterium]|nr:hypothetical protein [Chloroflexota bacterium]
MSERIFEFTELTATSTLQLLAEYLDADGALPELIEEMQIRVIPPPQVLEAKSSFDVLLSDPYKNASQKHAAVDALIDIYRGITGKDGPVFGLESDRSTKPQPLLSTLHELLKSDKLKRDVMSGRASDLPGHLIQDENILLACNITTSRGAEIFGQLYLATQVQVASAQVSIPNGVDQYILYHIKNDKIRGSDFVSGWRAELFKECVSLCCYQDKQTKYIVGMPESIVPRHDNLAYFCRILLKAPALFGGIPLQDNAETPSKILAVISPPNVCSHGTLTRILHTGGLHFVEEWRMAPTTASLTRCELLPLENSADGLEKLRRRIDEAVPRSGYQLELRHCRCQHPNEDEYAQLWRRQDQINDRMIELESLRRNRPRPRLYRFTQEQLPILADVLRSYCPDKLNKLRYGFYASRGYYPEGLHFIYANFDVTMSEMDPLVWWGDSETQPIEFWLDPHWAYYYRSDSYSQVFVPRGTRLYPSMHSWDVRTMDEYLKIILSEHYHGQGGVMALDQVELPLYVFDGALGYDQKLYVIILDLEQFVPISSPECLGWLNENLYLLDQWDDTKNLIHSISDTLTDERIRSAVFSTAESTEREFDKLGHTFRKTLQDKTSILFKAINQELETIIKDTEKFVVDANDLCGRAKKLWLQYESMDEQTEKTEQLVELTDKERQALASHITNLEESVNEKVQQAENKRIDLEQSVDRQVAELENTREKLQTKIHELSTRLKNISYDEIVGGHK